MTTPGGAADAARRRMEKLGGVMPSPRELPDATAVLPGAVSSATIAGEGASMSLPPQPSGSGLLYLHSISDPELRFVWVCPTKRFCFAFASAQNFALLQQRAGFLRVPDGAVHCAPAPATLSKAMHNCGCAPPTGHDMPLVDLCCMHTGRG